MSSGPEVATAVPPVVAPRGRTGFRWRLISSILLWGIMLAVIFWLPPAGLYLFLNLVIARALWEFYEICEAKGLRTFKRWGVVSAIAMVSGSWFFYGSRDFAVRSYDFDIFRRS
jgi:CDP-diglyceride synthetase